MPLEVRFFDKETMAPAEFRELPGAEESRSRRHQLEPNQLQYTYGKEPPDPERSIVVVAELCNLSHLDVYCHLENG